jgi:large conductance mechanosensitive channel
MGFVSEFKEFALKGNVMDLAVGVIIGGAFGKIVSSLVADVVMPIIGLFLGGINFSENKIILKAAIDKETPALVLNYGLFMQSVIDFTIVAFAIFLMVKGLNSLKKTIVAEAEKAPEAPVLTKEEILLTEIRDLLKSK